MIQANSNSYAVSCVAWSKADEHIWLIYLLYKKSNWLLKKKGENFRSNAKQLEKQQNINVLISLSYLSNPTIGKA